MEQTILLKEDLEEICEEGRNLMMRKNAEYGNSIRFGGVLSACYNIVGAAMRLPAMVFRSVDHGQKQADEIWDILIDIHNYSLIAMMYIRSDNWIGEPV